jgi:hypothetical protein
MALELAFWAPSPFILFYQERTFRSRLGLNKSSLNNRFLGGHFVTRFKDSTWRPFLLRQLQEQLHLDEREIREWTVRIDERRTPAEIIAEVARSLGHRPNGNAPVIRNRPIIEDVFTSD